MQTAVPANWNLGETEEGVNLNVLIIYDDIPAGQHAMRLLANLHDRVRGLELSPHFWRFDLLEDCDWYSIALADSGSADMIIISTSAPEGLDTSVKRWIEACLAQKSGTTAAVVVLFGPEEKMDSLDSERVRFAREAARSAGLECFAPQSPASPTLPHHSTRSTQMDALRLISPAPRWGINE